MLALRAWLSSDLAYERVGPSPGAGRKTVVLLHGYGAPGDDLVGLAEQLASTLPDASFLVPAAPHRAGGGRSWVPVFSAPTREDYAKRLAVEVDRSSALVWGVIDAARRAGAACTDIYVGGFSQGGRMAAETALRAPPGCDLGGVIVMSGGGLDEIALPAATGRMRVLVTHGTRDTVVGIDRGTATVSHFQAGGHEVLWLPFDGPHTIPPAVRDAIPRFLRDEDPRSWLAR